jgi:hypothetical protein
MSSEDDLVMMSIKLEVVVFEVGIVLYKESLEGSLISLVGARLVHLEGLGLLKYMEIYNLLLELANLITYFFNRVSLSLGNL